MITVLLAAPDLALETELVAMAAGLGLRIGRRCVDAVDLLAAAAADRVSPVVVSAGLPRLTRDVVDRIAAGRSSGMVGLAGTPADRDALQDMGISGVLMVASNVADTISGLRAVLDQGVQDPDDTPSGVWPTGVWAGREEPVTAAGRLVAVWGPTGAPGRTTVAIGLAEALERQGLRVGLADADTYGPSVAMALGLVEDASGLVIACRQADTTSLSVDTLLPLCHRVRRDWHVLGGVGRPDRWADLRTSALDRVWATCRSAFDVTVVDVGFCLEADGGGAWSNRRNAAAISAVTTADDVLAVAEASALGAARLISSWTELLSAAPSARRLIVQNRAGGRGYERRSGWLEALVDVGVVDPVRSLPLDVRAVDRSWASGRSLGEGARRSSLRRALGDLAGHLVSG
jgi:Flp pilus assembly CpaE family ATPase